MKTEFDYFWNNRWLLSILAGVLLGFSFPPFPFPFLQFPAFVLLFRLVHLSDSARQTAYYTYPGFVIWNIITTYWLMMATIPAGIAAILANAVLMSLTTMLLFKAEEKLTNSWLVALFQTAFWVSFEYLHFQWDLSWPWLTLGNGWAYATEFIQYISFTGVMSVSAWVMFTAALTFQAIKTGQRKFGYSALAIFILFPAASLIQLSTLSPESEETVEAVVVQPNFDSYQPLGGFATPLQALSHLLHLSDSARTEETALILWPESAIQPYLSDRKSPSRTVQILRQRIAMKAQQWEAVIIGGTTFFDYFYDDVPALARSPGVTPFLTYNAAVAFYPNGETEVYRKHNLVPVVERLPFVHFFNAVDLFGWLNWAKYQRLGQGNEAVLLEANSTRVPALICYDSVYPGWIRHFVQEGAGFITVITNDGWWGDSSGHIQHFAYARLAAIQFRRWIVRSANNGISGIIAPNGTVKIQTEYWTGTAFRYEVPVLHEATFYARFGNWLPIGMLIIAIAGLGYLFIKK